MKLKNKLRRLVRKLIDIWANFPDKLFSTKVTYIRLGSDLYFSDGLITNRNISFNENTNFKLAYERAIKAATWDYGIWWRTHVFLWALNLAKQRAGKDDIFIELGTGRGWYFSAGMEYLSKKGLILPTVHLFDTFDPYAIDEEGRRTKNISNVYAISFEEVLNNFREWENVHIHKGLLPDCLFEFDLKNICFLHIDLNCAEPEVQSLKYLWPDIIENGIILLDDYAFYEHKKQQLAIDELSQQLHFEILTLPTGQGLIIKTELSPKP